MPMDTSSTSAPEAAAGTDPAPAPALLRVEHETRYRYTSPVELAHHMTFLRPLEDAHQRVEVFEMQVEPVPGHHTTGRDTFGNSRGFFSITMPHESLCVRASSLVRVAARHAALRPAASPAWELLRERLRFIAGERYEPAAEFVFPSPMAPLHRELHAYARPSFSPGRPVAEAAIELMQRVHRDFRYEPQSTQVNTPVLQAFAQKRGVCQDFAHVMIGCLRSLGLAARYVSGYLLTEPPPGQPRLQGADASHAWVSVYVPGAGTPGDWLELDPTNDCVPGTSHVRLAVGRDYGDVTPLKGVIRGGGQHTLSVRVSTEAVPQWV
jgi:transglutaminase-like putative cysteine protease